MKSYNTEWIRNVGIVGHGDTGKTQLVSSLLYAAGMTPRLGKVAEGSTTTDWDEEEIARKISINTGLAYAEWAVPNQPEKVKINFFDTPGYSTFINETKSSLVAADASLIVVDAAAGVQVVTERVWDYATEYDQPRDELDGPRACQLRTLARFDPARLRTGHRTGSIAHRPGERVQGRC